MATIRTSRIAEKRKLEKEVGKGGWGVAYPSKVREFFIDSFESHVLLCDGCEGKEKREGGVKRRGKRV